MIKIGRFYLGVRTHGREKFRWFYHPLFHEKAKFNFFVWIGWHFYACMRLKNREEK